MAPPNPSTTTLMDGVGDSQSWSPFIENGKMEEDATPWHHRSSTSLLPSGPSPAGFFKAAPWQAWRDLRSASWGKCGLWGLYMIWIVILAYALIFLCAAASGPSEFGPDTSACQTDAIFSIYAYNWWAMENFFEISINAGKLTFTEVKAVDIAVQLIAGRGGQALLVFISWRAFRNYLTAKMVQSPVTFATFFAIFLQTEPTLVSTYRLIREFCLHRRPGSFAAGLFMPVTVIFLLVFPTFVNTITGYLPASEPFVMDHNDKMVGLDTFDKVAYIIHDGKRIGETDDHVVLAQAKDSLIHDTEAHYSLCYTWSYTHREGCDELKATSDYVKQNGFHGLLDKKTIWKDVKLDPPALNISGFYFPPNSVPYGHDWVDPRKENAGSNERRPFTDVKKTLFISDGEKYTLAQMDTSGICKPTGEYYRWGVAFIPLFIMIVALLVWSLGIAIMWFSGHRSLPLIGEPEVVCGWRAVVQLARAMEAELPAAGVDLDTTTDDGAKREVRKRLRGGAVSFKGHVLSRAQDNLRAATLAWLKKDWWWAGGLVVCLFLSFSSFLLTPVIPSDVVSSLAIIFWLCTGLIVAVLGLGTTQGSRLVMFFAGTVIILSITLPWSIRP